MAQQDTGLGWSAKGEWLMLGTGVMGSISRYYWDISGYESQNIPVLATASPSAADIVANGLLIYSDVAGVSPHQNDWKQSEYVVCDAPGAIICEMRSGTSFRALVFAPEGSTVTGCVVMDEAGTIRTRVVTYSHNSRYGYYFTTQNGAYQFGDSGTWYVPEFAFQSSIGALYTIAAPYALTQNVEFSKDNAGYAVACIASWVTPAGVTIVSPILISSISENTDMSVNTSGYNFARATFLLDGVRFAIGFFDVVNTSITSLLPTANLAQFGAATIEKVFRLIAAESFSNIIVLTSPDPYEEEGGEDGEDGGDGEETEDDENGIETNSEYPSAINTGFCRIYTPSETELRNLSNYLWSNSYDLNQVKKLFSNPMDSVLGLSAVPIRLSGTSVNFSLGGVQVPDMTLPMVSKQRYTYFMGGITVKERWGSYLDYDPYTKFSIFLPFIGMRELSTDDIMGKQVMLYYDIDILSGICTARLQAGKHCLYEWSGSCALQLPINSRNWDSVFNTAVSAVSGIVSAVSGGAAPLVAGSVASAALQTVSMKPRIDKSGNVSGASGWLGQMRPYLIRTTPEAYIPGNQNQYIGYPSYVSVSLGSLTGYNEVDSIHLEDIPATGDELAELESILKGGVIF